MSDHPMMKCGHAAQGKNQHGVWSCLICWGIDPRGAVVDDAPPSMEGRTAICSNLHRKPYKNPPVLDPVPSGNHLAFFEYKPNEKHDRYYCGCSGWD